jgi:hypothetical protein
MGHIRRAFRRTRAADSSVERRYPGDPLITKASKNTKSTKHSFEGLVFVSFVPLCVFVMKLFVTLPITRRSSALSR